MNDDDVDYGYDKGYSEGFRDGGSGDREEGYAEALASVAEAIGHHLACPVNPSLDELVEALRLWKDAS